jgi:branched-subunit amino acid ABC-type transport system permease component
LSRPCCSGLYFLLYRTSLGLMVRAGIEDPLMVGLLGINVRRMFLIVFAVGAIAAGVAGVIYAPMAAVIPDMGTPFLVQAFVVVVIGGLGMKGICCSSERSTSQTTAPIVGPSSVPTPGSWRIYELIATLFFLGYVLARFIVRSPIGTVLAGIRQNPDRTAALRHSVPGYKLAVFVLAAAYGGLAGARLGIFQSYMPPDAFSLDTSAQLVLQSVIGAEGKLQRP